MIQTKILSGEIRLLAISSLLFTSGCIATQDWVKEQLSPVNTHVSDNEASINQVGGRVTVSKLR